jgi:hypothetical protein
MPIAIKKIKIKPKKHKGVSLYYDHPKSQRHKRNDTYDN